MTTSPTSLFVSTRFGGQYCRPTPCGIWYLAQKPSIPTGESTKCLNLPILASEGDTKEISFKKKKKKKGKRAEEIGQEGKESLERQKLTKVSVLILILYKRSFENFLRKEL